MATPTHTHSLLALGGFLAATFSAAASGAIFQPGAWYESLAKPSWNPPAWIFGPVWTTLYVLMAVAAWLVWREQGWRAALWMWSVQLVLNAAWTALFFGLQRPGLAFAEIVALLAAIVATTVLFSRLRPLAAALMAPYLAWVTFAAVLNFTLWRLNA